MHVWSHSGVELALHCRGAYLSPHDNSVVHLTGGETEAHSGSYICLGLLALASPLITTGSLFVLGWGGVPGGKETRTPISVSFSEKAQSPGQLLLQELLTVHACPGLPVSGVSLPTAQHISQWLPGPQTRPSSIQLPWVE